MLSDSHACQSCSQEFDRGELRAKLAEENNLFLLVLIAVGYVSFKDHGLSTRRRFPKLNNLYVNSALFRNSWARRSVRIHNNAFQSFANLIAYAKSNDPRRVIPD